MIAGQALNGLNFVADPASDISFTNHSVFALKNIVREAEAPVET
jgi:hypothetical protein